MRLSVRILKRIPRSARVAVANKLSEIIEECVKTNELTIWQKLMTFNYYALRVSTSKSLSSVVKKNLNSSDDPLKDFSIEKQTSNLNSIIEAKIADGDVQDCCRLEKQSLLKIQKHSKNYLKSIRLH